MKIRHKFLTIIVMLCFSIMVLGSLAFLYHSLIAFLLMTVGICIATFVLMHTFFVKRVEGLNSDLLDVHAGSSKTQKVKVESHDELSEIASRVNVLLETVKLSRQQLFLLSEKSHNYLDTPLAKKSSFTSSENKLLDSIQFNETLNKAISYAKRHHKIIAILAIDLEFLNNPTVYKKEITSGMHDEIAKQFTNVLRNEDVLAKLDGNGFIILLHDIGKPKFASAVAEKLLNVVSAESPKWMLRASIGICICPDDTNTLEDAIEKTYAALHKAKVMPGNNYQFHALQLDEEAREYIHIKSDLQKALEDNELVLYYQPKLNIKRGCIVGLEALIRWEHPTLGILTPEKFLEVAEDSGYIIPLGEWALREACKVSVYWQKEGYEHITIGINLSIRQFYDPGLLKKLTSILNETGLNPNYLELEIYEETMMRDLQKTAEIMKNLVALGVQICIDHFGKGYTSISHLKNLPINTIKIDRSFIKGIPFNPNDSAITSAIIALAHYLGMYVLAEGVENAEQLQFLSQQNCDLVQGYFLSYPLPAETIIHHLKKISDRAVS